MVHIVVRIMVIAVAMAIIIRLIIGIIIDLEAVEDTIMIIIMVHIDVHQVQAILICPLYHLNRTVSDIIRIVIIIRRAILLIEVLQ